MTAQLARRMPLNMTPIEPINLIWLAFTLSVTASMMPLFVSDLTGSLANVVAVVGSAGCGWLWLLSRSLFRKDNAIEPWTLYALAAIITVEGSSNLVGPYTNSGPMAESYRVLANAEAFICVGAVAMVFTEVFSGYDKALSKHEQRFRQIFALSFGFMISATLLWVMNASDNSLGGQVREPILISTALFCILGTRYCIAFRKHNPLSPPSKPISATRFAGDDILAGRITEMLEADKAFATPDLKVADLAAALGEQDYKVTQCITGALGYRNFNHMINSYRINSAKEALDDPDKQTLPILSIAYDCGFNSIGPFNRAFKQQVGMTPRDYRARTH